MTQQKKTRVMITGARLPAALELIRALRAVGADVWAADTLSFTPAGASRDCMGYVRLPSPALAFTEFRACVRQAIERLQIDLIIPVSEEIFHLAQCVDDLAPAQLFAPTFTQLRQLHSKWDVLLMADGCGIRVPKTLRVASLAELRARLAEIPGGVLKPEFSRGAYHARFAPHTELSTLQISPANPWLIQEKLSGKEISTFSVARRGKLLAHASYEPCWRVARGASLYFRPVDAPSAARFVAEFVAKHKLTGQLSFDLMMEENGSIALIECNPRTTSGVHLFAYAEELGQVFLTDDVIENTKLAQVGTTAKAAKLAIALLHGARALRTGAIRTLGKDLSLARDSSFQMRDPLPLLSLYVSSLEILLRSRSWQVQASHAYTFDLEWNG